MTDFDQMTIYANYVKDDPIRRGLHFTAIEEALGDPNRKRILDIGCGVGLFPRLLAERGASVVAYDRAPQRIAEARAGGDAPGVDATFVVATPQTFLHDGTFDAATSVMVLQLATSPEELAAIFRLHLASLSPEEGLSPSSPIRCSRLWTGLRNPPMDQAGRQQGENRVRGSNLRSYRDDG